jgi:hypothetical protein
LSWLPLFLVPPLPAGGAVIPAHPRSMAWTVQLVPRIYHAGGDSGPF